MLDEKVKLAASLLFFWMSHCFFTKILAVPPCFCTIDLQHSNMVQLPYGIIKRRKSLSFILSVLRLTIWVSVLDEQSLTEH